MATPGTVAPIKQALVQTIRANVALKAALTGGVHEGIAPQATRYPFLTYQLHYAPYNYIWGSVMKYVGFDVFVWAENSVDANNVDALAAAALHDASLSVAGQSTLICRRTSDISSVDVDEEGKRIYQVGGTYEVWTDQPL